MSPISHLLFVLIPLVGAGILNMLFVNLPLLTSWRVPMDGGKVMSDGKRLFGDNKTWKGFVGMIVTTSACMSGMELWVKSSDWANDLSIIPFRTFDFPLNGPLYGAIWGLAYVLAELPNSYIKRRVGINAGENRPGLSGNLFKLMDQSDSVIGCVLVMPLFCPLQLVDGVAVVVLATGVHFVSNIFLFLVGLKKQAA